MTEAELQKNTDFIKLKENYPLVTFTMQATPVGLKVNNNSFVILLLQASRGKEGGGASVRVPVLGKQLPTLNLERACKLLTGMASR